MHKKFFGTDGIRGRVGSETMNPQFVLRLAMTVGSILRSLKPSKPSVLIGKDTRNSSDVFEAALQAGLQSAGVDVYLAGIIPTPAVAYLVRANNCDLGIVISASHNAYTDQGIKFFNASGLKIEDSLEQQIEQNLQESSSPAITDCAQLGHVRALQGSAEEYQQFCLSTLARPLDLSGLKIVLDCANGANYQIAPRLFAELGAEVIAIGHEPNGTNINAGCGSMYPDALKQQVLANKADLGIGFDGDGDRLLMVDDQGQLCDGDDLLYVLVVAAKQAGRLRGGVVGTVMTNFGLEQALQAQQIPFARTQVGDRYVAEKLRQLDWAFGGENSGHLILRDQTTTGDGLLAALHVLAVMAERKQSLVALRRDLKKLPQCLVSVPLQNMQNDPTNDARVSDKIQQINQALADKGRLLLRRSGTEAVMRIMVEGEDPLWVRQTAESLAEVIRCSGQ